MNPRLSWCSSFILRFFFNDTATTEIYTLSLHDALPISKGWVRAQVPWAPFHDLAAKLQHVGALGELQRHVRSEEHTSELQSLTNLVCRLLLEKKKKKNNRRQHTQRTHIYQSATDSDCSH